MTPDPRLGRPDRLVAVVGTGTAVGKTWVSARVCQTLAARGRAVAARKLAQSFVPGDLDARATDAHVLARATGDRPESVCPPHRWFEVPMAPPMAAQALGRPPFTVADLVAELHWPVGCPVGLLETAGGLLSPQADDGAAPSLLQAIGPDLVLVVADTALGVVHAVRAVVGPLGSVPTVVVLNRFDPTADLHRRSRDWLAQRDGLSVVALPGGEAEVADRILG
jgi:dethiobiotin synthetase